MDSKASYKAEEGKRKKKNEAGKQKEGGGREEQVWEDATTVTAWRVQGSSVLVP